MDGALDVAADRQFLCADLALYLCPFGDHDGRGAYLSLAGQSPAASDRRMVREIMCALWRRIGGVQRHHDRRVVNAISLYVEHGSDTFHSVHVETAAKIARAARQAGIKRFAHISGIGANTASSSLYIRSRGEGEAAVQTT